MGGRMVLKLHTDQVRSVALLWLRCRAAPNSAPAGAVASVAPLVVRDKHCCHIVDVLSICAVQEKKR